MERHDYFSRSKTTNLGPNGKRKFDKMWLELAKYLNSLGRAKRDVAGWKRVIIDSYIQNIDLQFDYFLFTRE